MEKIIDIDDFKKEEKKRKVKEWCEDKKAKIGCFLASHKQEILYIAPAAFLGGTSLVKTGVSAYRTHSENKHRNLETYDPRLGDYYKLKHKMSNSQKLELDRRMRNGESKGDILRSMRLI